MPRALRVARGAIGAGIATLLAAGSHALAGGSITWLAVVATALVAWPVCTAFAGRIGSLWRLTLGVVAAQFLFHWSFSGLGATSSGAGSGAAVEPAHAAHLAAAQAFAPNVSPDTTMWLMHAAAAVVTITLLHRGEHAFLALIGLLQRALPVTAAIPAPVVPSVSPLVDRSAASRLSEWLFSPSAITHRGPPVCV